MCLVIIIIIDFAEDFNRSFLELSLDLKSPELELKSLELELELKLTVSSRIGIGIGIENNGIGIGIQLKKMELIPTLELILRYFDIDFIKSGLINNNPPIRLLLLELNNADTLCLALHLSGFI